MSSFELSFRSARAPHFRGFQIWTFVKWLFLLLVIVCFFSAFCQLFRVFPGCSSFSSFFGFFQFVSGLFRVFQFVSLFSSFFQMLSVLLIFSKLARPKGLSRNRKKKQKKKLKKRRKHNTTESWEETQH